MSENAKWYVVHTYSGYENTVASSILKAAETRRMTDLILETKIPEETVVENSDGKEKEITRKVFPGYVMVKMVMTDESWHLVRNSRGCTGFVGAEGKPVPLTQEEVESLGVEHIEIHLGFEIGDTVKVIDGPLSGFSGTVEELDPDHKMLRLAVSMFGRETLVDLELDQVEPAEEE